LQAVKGILTRLGFESMTLCSIKYSGP